MPKPAKKAKTAKKDVALLEDTLREAPFVPDEGPGEGPGDSLLALPGGTRSRGVSPGAFAAIKAALEAVGHFDRTERLPMLPINDTEYGFFKKEFEKINYKKFLKY